MMITFGNNVATTIETNYRKETRIETKSTSKIFMQLHLYTIFNELLT